MRKIDFLFSPQQYKPIRFFIPPYHSRNLFFSFFLFLTWLSLGCSGITNSKVGTRSRPLYKSGELEKNEVWAGVIQITGDVVVPEGVTLTIKPGAIIGFDPLVGNHQLIVYGSFYAEGNTEGMIVFGSLGTEDEFELPKSGDWLGVRVMPTSPNARLTYCRLQHASTALLCQSDSVHIER